MPTRPYLPLPGTRLPPPSFLSSADRRRPEQIPWTRGGVARPVHGLAQTPICATIAVTCPVGLGEPILLSKWRASWLGLKHYWSQQHTWGGKRCEGAGDARGTEFRPCGMHDPLRDACGTLKAFFSDFLVPELWFHPPDERCERCGRYPVHQALDHTIYVLCLLPLFGRQDNNAFSRPSRSTRANPPSAALFYSPLHPWCRRAPGQVPGAGGGEIQLALDARWAWDPVSTYLCATMPPPRIPDYPCKYDGVAGTRNPLSARHQTPRPLKLGHLLFRRSSRVCKAELWLPDSVHSSEPRSPARAPSVDRWAQWACVWAWACVQPFMVLLSSSSPT